MKRIYHKLIRDRIPEIIETQGQCCIVKQLSDEEYLKQLKAGAFSIKALHCIFGRSARYGLFHYLIPDC